MIILEMTILKVFGGFSSDRDAFFALNGQFLRLSRAFYPVLARLEKIGEKIVGSGWAGAGDIRLSKTGQPGQPGFVNRGGKTGRHCFSSGGWPGKRLEKGGSTWKTMWKKPDKSGKSEKFSIRPTR